MYLSLYVLDSSSEDALPPKKPDEDLLVRIGNSKNGADRTASRKIVIVIVQPKSVLL